MAYRTKITYQRFYFNASPETIQRARELRQVMTEAELIIWSVLRNNAFKAYKFRRQHPI